MTEIKYVVGLVSHAPFNESPEVDVDVLFPISVQLFIDMPPEYVPIANTPD